MRLRDYSLLANFTCNCSEDEREAKSAAAAGSVLAMKETEREGGAGPVLKDTEREGRAALLKLREAVTLSLSS